MSRVRSMAAPLGPLDSLTLNDQRECEVNCSRYLRDFDAISDEQAASMTANGFMDERRRPRLMREKHVAYLVRGLAGLSGSYVALDASRPWLAYWILHSLDLLGAAPERLLGAAVATLARCQNPAGGFGGGPQQLSHCAPTYAATLALVCVATPAAYAAVDRPALYRFLLSMKDASGGFRMHDDGEVDVRGTYTALAVASLLNVLTPELKRGAGEYALACQTYEGGFGGEPGVEAHGGYVFCALAALAILNETDKVDLDGLERWSAHRQTTVEGGFQGRTNKLVDGCYSFWQFGTLALASHIRKNHTAYDEAPPGLVWRPASPSGVAPPPPPPPVPAAAADVADDVAVLDLDDGDGEGHTLGDERALQRYILLCAQCYPEGGLRDKPGKSRDYYHTCYCLSGLSASQRAYGDDGPLAVYGDPGNLLHATHPVYNVRVDRVEKAFAHFKDHPSSHADLTRE